MCGNNKYFCIMCGNNKYFCCHTLPTPPTTPTQRCCGTYFKTKCRLAERRGSVNCVVRLLWSTKYTLPVAVFRISQPGGRGPSSSQLTLLRSLKYKFENTIRFFHHKRCSTAFGKLKYVHAFLQR